jgi:Na+-transporting methylmalonyl-CoA/oxaloacetate decarboxylase gamma subunit
MQIVIDIAPDPAGMGVVLAVILFVCAVVIALAGALVLFLWCRKRSSRHTEMIRPNSPEKFR